MPPHWAVSVISHGHGALVARVLRDVHAQLAPSPHCIVLTLNAGEDDAFVETLPASLQQSLRIKRNEHPRGFGANHNAALLGSDAEFVLMADPDLALPLPIFGAVETALLQPDCGIVAPVAVTPDGIAEDNGRALLTPWRLLRRYAWGRGRERCPLDRGALEVDWLAGLFLAMRGETFRQLGGFDEAFYLYCEDVDLCLRARAHGLRVRLLSDLRITHAARRGTLKSWQHLRWHLASLLRLWRSPAYRHARQRGAP